MGRSGPGPCRPPGPAPWGPARTRSPRGHGGNAGGKVMARTEREKMLAGELYLANDPELVEMRRRARELTAAYNRTTQDEAAERARLLRALLGRCDPGVWV